MHVYFVTEPQLLFAAGLAAGIAIVSFAARLLTASGAIAAFAIGFIVFGFGGLPFAAPLLVFFFSSSLLSHLGAKRKSAARANYSKGSKRDAAQALANGGVPTALALLSAFDLRSLTPRVCMMLYLAALAAVNGDTWATEIGGLVQQRPVLITTLRRVEPGTSGAVSLLGILGAAAGAVCIVSSGWAAWPSASIKLFWRIDPAEMLSVAWGGFVAVFADSILGASLQAQYRCSRCSALVESPRHCSTAARLERGVPWVTNDTVNFATSALGVLFTWLLLKYKAYP